MSLIPAFHRAALTAAWLAPLATWAAVSAAHAQTAPPAEPAQAAPRIGLVNLWSSGVSSADTAALFQSLRTHLAGYREFHAAYDERLGPLLQRTGAPWHEGYQRQAALALLQNARDALAHHQSAEALRLFDIAERPLMTSLPGAESGRVLQDLLAGKIRAALEAHNNEAAAQAVKDYHRLGLYTRQDADTLPLAARDALRALDNAPPETAARAVIATAPAGAAVWLNGTLRGHTPLTLENPQPGLNFVVIEALHTRRRYENLFFDAKPRTFAYDLEPAPATGLLETAKGDAETAGASAAAQALPTLAQLLNTNFGLALDALLAATVEPVQPKGFRVTLRLWSPMGDVAQETITTEETALAYADGARAAALCRAVKHAPAPAAKPAATAQPPATSAGLAKPRKRPERSGEDFRGSGDRDLWNAAGAEPDAPPSRGQAAWWERWYIWAAVTAIAAVAVVIAIKGGASTAGAAPGADAGSPTAAPASP